ncbi:hypothetical protein DL98DRAFT_624170 [Cadophora sp. DSE1049]|nr:hypothetical protein DL98DRAFT_624170 [Cadophora sp. DSE1049]
MVKSDDYVGLTVYQLRSRLKSRSLPRAGNKNELLARLIKHDETKPVDTAAADFDNLTDLDGSPEQSHIEGNYKRSLVALRAKNNHAIEDKKASVMQARAIFKSAEKSAKTQHNSEEEESRVQLARFSLETAEKRLVAAEKELATEEDLLAKERSSSLSKVLKRVEAPVPLKTGDGGLKAELKEVNARQGLNSASAEYDDESSEELFKANGNHRTYTLDDFGNSKPVVHRSLQELIDPYKRKNKRQIGVSGDQTSAKRACPASLIDKIKGSDTQPELIEKSLIKPTLGSTSHLLVTAEDKSVRGDFVQYVFAFFKKIDAVEVRADRSGYLVFFKDSFQGDVDMSKCHCDTREGCSVYGVKMKVKQVGCAFPWRCVVLV